MDSAEKKASGGGLGALVTTAIGVYLGNSSHPYLARALYVAAVLELIFVILQWSWVQRRLGLKPIETVPSGTSGNASASAGRDNLGSQFSALHSPIYGTDALQALLSRSPETVPSLAPKWPEFDWSFRFARVIGSNGVWRESRSHIGYQALLLDISAVAPARGTQVRECTVYGAIKLYGSDLEHSVSLNRLCWIGEIANEMKFEIGKSATLLVLCFEGNLTETSFNPNWITFQSPVDNIPENFFMRSEWSHDGEFGKKVALPVNGPPMLTISFVNSYSRHVVDAKRVRLRIHGESDWRVTEVKDEA